MQSMTRASLWQIHQTFVTKTITFSCGDCRKASKQSKLFIGKWTRQGLEVVAANCTQCGSVNTFWYSEKDILTPTGPQTIMQPLYSAS